MKDRNAFCGKGKWFKGNLHCHSTNSDASWPPEEVASIYKKSGWDFLAFTDHELYTYNHELEDENFLIIPGIELSAYKPDPYRIYHVVGIGDPGETAEKRIAHREQFTVPDWESKKTAQSLIDNLTEKNNLAILCHPNWSRMEFEDIQDVSGFFAMEIYNNGCALETHTGTCIDYWDSLLRRGRKVWGVATDDSHQYIKDYCGGWVMVNADELTHKAIINSLANGSFYSSNGPEIKEFKVVNGEVIIECSPVEVIHFVAYENLGVSCWAEKGSTISSATHKLKGTEKYVRVECVDKYGKTAWTNPIFI